MLLYFYYMLLYAIIYVFISRFPANALAGFLHKIYFKGLTNIFKELTNIFKELTVIFIVSRQFFRLFVLQFVNIQAANDKFRTLIILQFVLLLSQVN